MVNIGACRNSIKVMQNLSLDESETENENKHSNRKNHINSHSGNALRIKLGDIVVFVLDAVAGWNLHNYDLVREP